MNASVDLTNLRSMTDGDVDMERELFGEFFHSFELGIAALHNASGGGCEEDWRKQAHSLKGIALNLGAQKLGGFCKRAQDECMAPQAAKEELLAAIKLEYAQVRLFLERLMEG